MFNPFCYDAWGGTPLHIAAYRGLFPVVKWLCEDKGAMITAINHEGYKASDMAYRMGYNRVGEYLVARTRLIGKERFG